MQGVHSGWRGARGDEGAATTMGVLAGLPRFSQSEGGEVGRGKSASRNISSMSQAARSSARPPARPLGSGEQGAGSGEGEEGQKVVVQSRARASEKGRAKNRSAALPWRFRSLSLSLLSVPVHPPARPPACRFSCKLQRRTVHMRHCVRACPRLSECPPVWHWVAPAPSRSLVCSRRAELRPPSRGPPHLAR